MSLLDELRWDGQGLIPAVVQDTGFSQHIPVGKGLFAYDSVDDAVEAIEAIVSDWSRHSSAAREIARNYFDSDVVLSALLERAMAESHIAAPKSSESWRTPTCVLRR